MALIALLTDFGTSDWYVASMKGVLLSLAPSSRLIDISHDLSPHDITAGAFVLAESARWFPKGTVFLAVIDPGVGSDRPVIAAEADGRRFIGPDNGLLGLALARAARPRVVRLMNPSLRLPAVSNTFHGRDLLAPAAAALARRVPLRHLGPLVDAWQPAPWPHPRSRGGIVEGEIVLIDRFGNAISNIAATTQRPRAVRLRGRTARVVSSYAEGQRGKLLALIGSHGYVECAMVNGSAAAAFRIHRGDLLTVWSA
jgi:S-adenosylmethionine hydrolase